MTMFFHSLILGYGVADDQELHGILLGGSKLSAARDAVQPWYVAKPGCGIIATPPT